MLNKQTAVLLSGLLTAATAFAQPLADADSNWYLHANFDEMRSTEAGRYLYQWFQDEVQLEIEDELGIALEEELDAVSIFGLGDEQEAVIILHGEIAPAERQRIIDHLREEAGEHLSQASLGGRDYYLLRDEEHGEHHHDALHFAFGDGGQHIVTGDYRALERFLNAGAQWNMVRPEGLIVLQAGRPLVQGGMRATGSHTDHIPWESDFFRNVEQLALVVADGNGALELHAEAVATNEQTALAMQSIVQGLIGLQLMTAEGPDAMALLGNLKTSTEGKHARFSLRIPPEALREVMD